MEEIWLRETMLYPMYSNTRMPPIIPVRESPFMKLFFRIWIIKAQPVYVACPRDKFVLELSLSVNTVVRSNYLYFQVLWRSYFNVGCRGCSSDSWVCAIFQRYGWSYYHRQKGQDVLCHCMDATVSASGIPYDRKLGGAFDKPKGMMCPRLWKVLPDLCKIIHSYSK